MVLEVKLNYIKFGFFLFFFISLGHDVFANDLKFNAPEFKKIERACPECIDNQVMICGNQNIPKHRHRYPVVYRYTVTVHDVHSNLRLVSPILSDSPPSGWV